MSSTQVGAGFQRGGGIVSILDKLSKFVRSLTSNEANEDAPSNVDPPPADAGPVEMPDREPMVGHEPERDS
jgi:hypothetical protein